MGKCGQQRLPGLAIWSREPMDIWAITMTYVCYIVRTRPLGASADYTQNPVEAESPKPSRYKAKTCSDWLSLLTRSGSRARVGGRAVGGRDRKKITREAANEEAGCPCAQGPGRGWCS